MISEYQTSFFDQYPVAPGWKARDTSQDAAKAIEPENARLKRLCLEQFRNKGPQTADDCAAGLNIDRLSIRPRCSELAALGLIEDSGQRGVNASGRKAIIWRLAEQRRAA